MDKKKKIVILSDQTSSSAFPLDPLTKKIVIKLPPRRGGDNRGDVDTLRQTLVRELGTAVTIPLSKMAEIQKIRQSQDQQITVTLAADSFFDAQEQVQSWRLMEIEKGDQSAFHLGVAVDIGTTTVVVYLVDMITGQILGQASDYNHQIQLGEDILSRIMAAASPEGLAALQGLIVETLNSLVEEVCQGSSIKREDIIAVCLGANTTMIHLLLGLNPASICRAPYIPMVNNPEIITAREIGLQIHPLAPLYCLPSVGSYLGGDVIGGILVSGMHKEEGLSLFADVGTNGEFVIGNQDWLVACAGAAGPALEGGVTEWGMRAEEGAIDSVAIDDDFHVTYTTIHGTPAKGICGSGLIDALAELFLSGLIDRAAHFFDGREAFILVTKDETAHGKDIFISQKDINNLMRTKGAVNTALEVLVEGVGCSMEEIYKFYAAGAFGQYIPIESAVTVGLYPDLPRERMIRLGNSSGEGARQVLLSNAKRLECEKIAAKITYFEMNDNISFMDKYAGSKFLPHTNLDLYPSVQDKLNKRRRGK
ncbi:ASKHA domain-containing protein [Dehalobacterium formicoaceticum]|uniref:ASKHA domain-containing protein n=1 Tax=Dehalobacterium formicoaceticum TaxID=51515 RepID=A0ABT1Y012_9FIRM|nr:ASKHA domain-containing protein [Dehalobacterium formicoaceticum]MCR6544203.1 ASKHA domain-containing protein [Dehalobacterium formicoaceticum]